MAPAKKKTCTHRALCLDASEHGRATVGFQRVPVEKRIAAATTAGRPSPTATGPEPSGPDASAFPGPLVLPDDELALNPKYPPQSLRSWMRGGHRNAITPERKTLYVAGPPALGEDVGFMGEWAVPRGVDHRVHPDDVPRPAHPAAEDVIAYLAAFYHPLPVKKLPAPLRFVAWDEKKKPTDSTPGMVGLAAAGSDVAVGIRARPSPDGIARGQLNLGDVLDALASAMPRDAYAAVMLCEQDLYEDEEDEFCCGRAFGGSRISVVSSFRYRPVLDVVYGIEGAHCWPAAHCARYVGKVCEEAEEEEEGKGKKRKRGGRIAAGGEVAVDVKKRPGTAMGAAVAAARGVLVPRTGEAEEGMWLARVARTAAHELGHCFGMDHCVYYACSMQGSAGLVEDGRQPPYLCPVCEGKFVYGVGEMGVVPGCKFGKWEEGREEEVRRERMRAMKGFCERWEGVGMFAGFGAWLGARMKHEGDS